MSLAKPEWTRFAAALEGPRFAEFQTALTKFNAGRWEPRLPHGCVLEDHVRKNAGVDLDFSGFFDGEFTVAVEEGEGSDRRSRERRRPPGALRLRRDRRPRPGLRVDPARGRTLGHPEELRDPDDADAGRGARSHRGRRPARTLRSPTITSTSSALNPSSTASSSS